MCTLAQNIQTLQTRYLQSTGEIERGDTFAFEITRDIDMSLCAIFGQILLICKEMDKDPYELWDAYIDTIGTK